ncbi:MAG: YraN family protein [Candidatus Omnitrophota bacterium]|jgi:putative endonuclease
MTFARIDSGRNGEEQAVSYLRRKGYRIIERNYRAKTGEIDIIARHGECTCFVEVRAKNAAVFGTGEESILKKKQMRISRTALTYIKKHRLENKNCRFDVVSIEGVDSRDPEVKVIENAFDLDARYSY